ncbi:MAG: MFS transporter [Spirochaetaceae bacterium]|nr:MFS transporter [Spirochaetaceae bacterium]
MPFYYGWIVLAVGALGILFSIPGQTIGVSVFTDHLIEILNLSRIRLSTAYMTGTLLSALMMTSAGRLYDKLGARSTASGAVLLLAFFLVLMTRVDGILAFFSGLMGGGPVFYSIAAFILITLGFLGIRFFGQGLLTLVSRTMVMKWFEERRGRASAILGISISAGFSYAPRFLQSLIDGKGWRGAWVWLAGALMVTALPMVLVFFRDTPERCGLEMEGGLRHLKIHKDKFDHHGPDATLAHARRDPRYWAYALMLGWWSLYNTAFTFHIVDIFASRGLDTAEAVAIFLPITIVSVLFNFLVSWSSDAMDLPPLFFLAVAGFLATGLGILNPAANWSRPVLIAGMGIAGGTWSVLSNITWPRLYGRQHLGEIGGSVMTFLVAGSAVGPWLFSILRRENGYVGAGLLGILGPLCLGLFGLFVFFRRGKGTGR